MIDFKTKTLYFGYGDIGVSNVSIGIRFREFQPEVEVGTILTDDVKNQHGIKYTSDSINIYICSYEEAECLERLLDRMDGRDMFYFAFKDWVFNFSIWNPKSIDAIKNHLNIVKGNLSMCIAC